MAVDTFNTRTGNVTLLQADVTTALTFSPEDAANKKSSGDLGTSTTLFPAEAVVKTYVDTVNAPTDTANSGFTTTTFVCQG